MSSPLLLATETEKKDFFVPSSEHYQAVFICNMTNRWLLEVLTVQRPDELSKGA
jgi:hypothetical protein